MCRCNRWLAGLLLAFSGLLSAAPQSVVVMTSYPEEVMTRVEDGFAQAHPEYRLQVLWRQGLMPCPTCCKPDRAGWMCTGRRRRATSPGWRRRAVGSRWVSA
ncbi:hypothetical protein NWF32_29130 [Pseudomonas qingdaonensis]|nr:hypothetical protein [Pseudomonas qingdaonensis]